VHHAVIGTIMFAQFMDLGMAVVAGRNAVSGTGGLDLIVLELSVLEAFFLESGLQKTATPAAAEIIRTIGVHIDKILFSNHGLHHETQVFGNRIPVAFANDLAGVLYGKFYFQIFVPVGIDLESAFPDPAGIVLVNALDFKVVRDIEFFQSGPD
jgi:hypothetical protein